MAAIRFYIVATLCLITSIGAGCAATYQKVDVHLLEQNRNMTFKPGLVKAVGKPMSGFWGASGIEYKMKALDRVQVAEICSILSSKYSITIDATVDKTSKVVKEAIGAGPPSGGTGSGASYSFTLQPSIDNAYYGNLRYDESSTLGILFGSSSQVINSNEFPNAINMIYSLDYDSFGFKTSFHYDIAIRSSDQDIVTMHGIIASISTPTKYGFGDQEAIWKSYVDYAGRISDALRRDLLEPTDN
jgi:hypothetical protein